jgi:hypothetical protein
VEAAMADDGFLSRWSRRKVEAKEGKAIELPAVVPEPTPAPQLEAAEPEPVAPPPTLEDTQSLTFDSDFKRFIAPDVAPEVKNAAVKKLFADPRFNVRDAMDVYADDYSKPDPLPDSMLRKLASAQFLKLFEENADDGADQSVAQSSETPPEAVPEPPHADPDLRLQQDHAPAGENAGDGIEPGASAAHDAVPARGGSVPEGGEG